MIFDVQFQGESDTDVMVVASYDRFLHMLLFGFSFSVFLQPATARKDTWLVSQMEGHFPKKEKWSSGVDCVMKS